MDFFSDPVLLDSFGIFWNILESFKLIFNPTVVKFKLNKSISFVDPLHHKCYFFDEFTIHT